MITKNDPVPTTTQIFFSDLRGRFESKILVDHICRTGPGVCRGISEESTVVTCAGPSQSEPGGGWGVM